VITQRAYKNAESERHIKLKVLWQRGGRQWVDADALRGQSPFLSKLDWVKKVDNPECLNHLCRQIRLTNRDSMLPRYKFGIEVPRSVFHALELDLQNRDTQSQIAMNTELSQISEYKTFREAEPGQDLSKFQKIPCQA
jgi:hypothetical protein